MQHSTRRAFSAIHLIISIALVALLAAIITPNYSRLQNSSDVALAKADMQSLIFGLEVYKLDRGAYPWCNSLNSALKSLSNASGMQRTLERLTTPVSYLSGTTPFYDPFQGDKLYVGGDLETTKTALWEDIAAYKQYFYHARNLRDSSVWHQSSAQDTDPVWYTLESTGPDKTHHLLYQLLNQMSTDTEENRARLGKLFYDPTNGAISRGSIWKVGGEPAGYATSMAAMINSANSSAIPTWSRY